GDTSVVSFEAIDGFDATEIYAVGRRGEIWQYDGKLWAKLDSPTNMILTNVCCAGDGEVYACGRLGTLLRGRHQRWEPIEHEGTKEDFWGIAWFNSQLYLATLRAVFLLQGDKLRRIEMGEDGAGSFYHLSSIEGELWSVGPRE